MFNLWPGRGLNFGRPSFAPPSVDRDVKAVGLVSRRWGEGRGEGGTLNNPRTSRKE